MSNKSHLTSPFLLKCMYQDREVCGDVLAVSMLPLFLQLFYWGVELFWFCGIVVIHFLTSNINMQLIL